MKRKMIGLMAIAILSAGSSAAMAMSNNEHVLLAPNCLLKNITGTYSVLGSNKEYTIVNANEDTIESMAEAKKSLKSNCGGFTDITMSWNTAKFSKTYSINDFITKQTVSKSIELKRKYQIQYTKATEDVIKTIKPKVMWKNLTTLTQFKDRSSRTENGVLAAAWIKDTIETMAKDSGHDDVKVYYVATGGYSQPSIVAKFGDSNEPAIVIGGHMDTLSSSYELKPGADDDGSGSVTVLGVARTILNSHLKFKRPIYFIWYAAEEMGLVGSSYVVRDFQEKNIAVDAVIQFDMTGYREKNDPTIWLMQDNVNLPLTKFIGELVKTYVKTPTNTTRCGYGCSDHASWTDAGYKSSMPFETQMNHEDPYIHTSGDKMDYLSLEHITNFAKLGTAFAVELAEPLN